MELRVQSTQDGELGTVLDWADDGAAYVNWDDDMSTGRVLVAADEFALVLANSDQPTLF